jgi:hypothetical protein
MPVEVHPDTWGSGVAHGLASCFGMTDQAANRFDLIPQSFATLTFIATAIAKA